MNSEYIHILLDRYWNCVSSPEEEQQLHEYFSGPNVPEELSVYIPLFAYTKEERSLTTSRDFNQKLEAALQKSKKKQYITIRVFTPLLRIAASVLLIAGLGLSALLISKQFNKPYFAETYHDPNVAIKDATNALLKLSQALRASDEASIETIHYIDGLEIDWTSLDSINSTAPQVILTEEPVKESILEEVENQLIKEQINKEIEQEDDL